MRVSRSCPARVANPSPLDMPIDGKHGDPERVHLRREPIVKSAREVAKGDRSRSTAKRISLVEYKQ